MGLDGFSEMGAGWQTRYNTVTLALAGTVDAMIDWGDGSPVEYVRSPGPLVHDYDVDGIYTVSVTGNVTAYNICGIMTKTVPLMAFPG